MKKLLALLLCVVCVAAIFAGCNNTTPSTSTSGSTSETPSGSETTPPAEKTVVYGSNNSWNRLMPYDLTGMNMVMVADKVFDVIGVKTGDGLGLRAAESIDVEDGGKTFVIKLRENSYWHDGEQVTAEDWVWALTTIADPGVTGIAGKSYLNVFEGTDKTGTRVEGETFGVEQVDKFTMKWHLKDASNPEAFFFSYNTRLYPLPKHILGDVAPDKLNEDPYWDAPVGSGPFKFVSAVQDQELVLEAWDKFELGRPKFDKLIYKIMDKAAFPNALLAGEIDTCHSCLTAKEALALDGQNGLHTDLVTSNTVNYVLTVNNEKFDAKVRRAFSLLIDKDTILESVFNGDGMVAESWVLPSNKYYSPAKFERNVEEAKKLLEEAKFDFKQKLTLGASNTVRQGMAAIIQQNFAELGIEVEVQQGDDLMQRASSGDIDMIILSWTATASPTYWLAYQYGSYSRIQDTKYSDALKAVDAETDETKKMQMMVDAQELYRQECPYILLLHEYSYMVLSEKLHGVTIPNCDECWNWVVD